MQRNVCVTLSIIFNPTINRETLNGGAGILQIEFVFCSIRANQRAVRDTVSTKRQAGRTLPARPNNNSRQQQSSKRRRSCLGVARAAAVWATAIRVRASPRGSCRRISGFKYEGTRGRRYARGKKTTSSMDVVYIFYGVDREEDLTFHNEQTGVYSTSPSS